MFFNESEFERQKRNSEGKFKLGLFYSNPNDDRLIVPSRWKFGRPEINIAHPRFRKILLSIVILIVALVIISEYFIQ